MQKAGSERTRANAQREGRGSMWILAGAAMLCPVSHLIVLASVGGALGGLLSNKWFLAGLFAVLGAAIWLGVRLVRKQLAKRGQGSLVRCGGQVEAATDVPPARTTSDDVKEYTT
jgi:hypothetical protein